MINLFLIYRYLIFLVYVYVLYCILELIIILNCIGNLYVGNYNLLLLLIRKVLYVYYIICIELCL